MADKEEKIKTLLQSFGICNTALEEYAKLVFDCVNDRRVFVSCHDILLYQFASILPRS